MNIKKVVTIIIVIILILAMAGTIIFINFYKVDQSKTGQKTKAITENDIIKDESFSGLNFTNTTLIKENGQYKLQIDVTNPSDSEIDIEEVNVVFTDKNGNEIVTLLGYIGEPMKAKETRTITSYANVDLSKAKSKTIEAKK